MVTLMITTRVTDIVLPYSDSSLETNANRLTSASSRWYGRSIPEQAQKGKRV